MTYAVTNPPKLLVRFLPNTPGFWFYSSTDANTTVDGAGYITNAKALGMRVGDFVFSQKSDDAALISFVHTVVTVNATTGVADLSNGSAFGGASNSD